MAAKGVALPLLAAAALADIPVTAALAVKILFVSRGTPVLAAAAAAAPAGAPPATDVMAAAAAAWVC